METRFLAASVPGAIEEAAAALARGELVAFPTDTVYGLACRPGDLDRLFAAKDRPAERRIPVLLASRASLGAMPPAARALAARWWPGPLTLVLPGADGTVAYRVPASDLARRLIAAAGGSLPVTSANRSGGPEAGDAAEVLRQLGGRIDLILDGGPIAGVASTIVDCSTVPPRVLREGAISARDIDAALRAVAA